MTVTCWSEESIERAAIRLIGVGSPTGEAVDPTRPDTDRDFQQLLEHSDRCFRCRDLLQLFLDLHVSRREAEARSPARLLLLAPVAAARPEASGSDLEEPAPAYLAAADTPGAGGGPDQAISVLTLSSVDGRTIVRIFPTGEGRKAQAVLIREEDEAVDPETGRPAEPASYLLRIGSTEYRFDEGGHVSLPEFPAPPILLLIDEP